jgi:hypothetical protein
MTLMPFNQLPNGAIGPLAMPLSVEGVDDSDPAGHVSREILLKGTRIVIPYWIDPVPNDELWVMLRQNGVENRLYTVFYPSPLNVTFLYFDLTSQHLATDGIAFVYYKIWKGSGGTDDPSPERQLTIDHTPLLELLEPWFRHATLWGYLNNNTKPPLTSGATVVIPAFTNVAVPGDVAKVHWRGYSSLNGSGPEVPGTYGFWDKPLSAADITNGFDHVVPYQPHIRQLFDNDSAIVICQLLRGGRLIAESKKGLVKIDQVTSGESGQLGLNEGEKQMTAQEKLIFKARSKTPKLFDVDVGVNGSGALATAISIDTLADGSIPVRILNSGKLIITLQRPAPEEEDKDDDLDVWIKQEGGSPEKIDYIQLGPIADRASPITLEVDASLFPELAQPATPTNYDVQVILYKGSGGTDDPSNIVPIVIDRTAPFEVKYPSRRKNPPTPAPTFVNAPADAQRTINEAYITANTQLDFTVFVGYPLRRLDDELTVRLTSGTVTIEVFKRKVPDTGEFNFPSAELRKLPNGRVTISYAWTDLPENVSANSAPAAVFTLGLALDPVLNAPPLVPKTDPDGTTTIYLEDIDNVEGVVNRATIDNAEPGDEIIFYMEDALDPTNFVDFGTQPLAAANLTFPLPYIGKLKDVFGTSEEAKEVRVWFELIRGGISFESPDFFFWLDLYPSGGLYPELPDLTNPSFVLPVVTGASDTPDSILPGDRDKPGKFAVTLALTDPPITAAETVKCYVNNQPVGEFSPFADAIEFDVPISAAIMSALPTPSVLAHWTRQKSGIDKNVISSGPKTVLVSGRKIDLLPPIIRIRNPSIKDQIDCFAMNNATTNWVLAVTIPKDSTNLPQGKVITVHFAAYSDAGGINLIPDTEDSQPYTIQAAGTVDVASVANAAVFKAAQPRRGTRAFGKYWYTADIGGEQTSVPIIKPLDTITSSGEYCDRLAVPSA